MMSQRHNGFLLAVMHAALSGLGFAAAVKLLTRFTDPTTAAALYLTLVAAGFVVLADTTGSRKAVGVLLIVVAGLTSAALADTLFTTLVVLTAVFGFSRARIVYRARLAKPWLVELCLAAAALLAAQLTVRHSLGGIAISVWTYWLVQSAYFLLPVASGAPSTGATDPFDVAMKRAAALMDNES